MIFIKFTTLFLVFVMSITSLVPTTAFATEVYDTNLISNEDIISVDPVQHSTSSDRPADAKVIEVIDILVDENGIVQEVTPTPSVSPYSYYSPAAITLSASGNWYYGQYRTFDGNYVGWEVTAKYADNSTSSVNGLYIGLTSYTAAGDLNRKLYAIPLDGKTYKPEDWRKKLGTSDDFRFMYYNATYDTSSPASIWIKVTVYSWD